MNVYENIAAVYDKWFSSDPAYHGSGLFYVSALSQMRSGSYLELGIGTGRISLEAVRSAPITVTGIDISPQMLAVCRERYDAMSEKKGTLCLCEGDAANLAYHEEFEGAIMPYHAVAHFLTEEALNSLFRGVFSALKPGGWFLMDDFSLNQDTIPEWVNTDEPIIEYQDPEVTISDRFQCDFNRNLMHIQLFMNNVLHTSLTVRWRETGEIKAHAEQAGLEILSLMGDFDGSVWTEQSPEQIWFFRKPGNSGNVIQLPLLDVKYRTASPVQVLRSKTSLS